MVVQSIKKIQQPELNELAGIISDCNIIPVVFAKELLKKRGKNDLQINAIINQIVKRKLAYYDESETILRVNKGFNSSDLNLSCVKTLWLILDLLDNIQEYFIQTDIPHYATFFNKTAASEGLNPIYDVFYVKYLDEKISEYKINNFESNSNLEDKINAFIILDNKDQIKSLKINENRINIVAYVLVSITGKVEYIFPEEKRGEGE